MANDSFWTDFLRPLSEKEKPGKYDTEFNKWLNFKPQLTLQKNENEDSRCLSRMIVKKLQVQTEQTEKGKKRKVAECNLELGRLIKTIDLKSQSRESSRSAHREATPSTSVVRFHDSVSATNLANPERVDQQGACKPEADGILGKVLRCIKYWLGYRRPKRSENKKYSEVDYATQSQEEDYIGDASSAMIIDLTNEETSINTYWAEEHEARRFKNVVVSSAVQSPMIADRQKEYLDEDEDTEDEIRLDPSQEDNLRKIAGIVNRKDKIDKQKSHQQSCVSSWTLKGLNSYITSKQLFEKTLNASNVKVEQFDRDRFSDLQTSLVHRSRQILAYCQCFNYEAERGLKLWSLQFSEPTLKEMTVSLMVFEVLCAVCQRCNVRLKPEEVLPKGEYPYARADYALAYKDVVFGVVEIKTPKTMAPAALVQLLLSLLKLQNESGQEKMQYVGILTDGFRYAFVRLEGEKFTFEYDGSTENPKLHIRRAVKWNDLYALCDDMQSVFKSATARLEKLTKK